MNWRRRMSSRADRPLSIAPSEPLPEDAVSCGCEWHVVHEAEQIVLHAWLDQRIAETWEGEL